LPKSACRIPSFWDEEGIDGPTVCLLDGRNRLDAMEQLGYEVVKDGKLAPGVNVEEV